MFVSGSHISFQLTASSYARPRGSLKFLGGSKPNGVVASIARLKVPFVTGARVQDHDLRRGDRRWRIGQICGCRLWAGGQRALLPILAAAVSQFKCRYR